MQSPTYKDLMVKNILNIIIIITIIVIINIRCKIIKILDL